MELPRDDDTLFAALIARDPSYEGFAYVGVTTTGIFCRLTCPARKPKRTNVVFFSCRDAAQDAGFRACLRCKPLDLKRPTSGALETLRDRIKAEPDRRWSAGDVKGVRATILPPCAAPSSANTASPSRNMRAPSGWDWPSTDCSREAP